MCLSDMNTVFVQVASSLQKEDKLRQLKSSKIIVSCYQENFTDLIEQSSHLVDEMQSIGADIIKFVSNASTITENLNVFDMLTNSQVRFLQFRGVCLWISSDLKLV